MDIKGTFMSSKNKQRGYRFEKVIAERFSTFRMGTMGGEDVYHPEYSIECKDFARFAGVSILEQAEKNNKRGVIPLGIVHIRNTSYDKSIVLLRLSDFEKLRLKGEV